MFRRWGKWLVPGIGVKRWLLLLMVGLLLMAFGIASAFLQTISTETLSLWLSQQNGLASFASVIIGALFGGIAILRLSNNLLAPYRRNQSSNLADDVYAFRQSQRGMKFVAIGGGTGLPVVLTGMKPYTQNITAIVTVADDGGSSGRLRQEMQVIPPGDLRNNIVALADDTSLLTRLFQYRFQFGDLKGHAFGNLFISALSEVVHEGNGQDNSLAEALIEVERILNINGRVLPATLNDVHLVASVKLPNSSRVIRVQGESKIGELNGQIQQITLEPSDPVAYPDSVQAILDADVIVLGPGSLYTSILPNLMITGIAHALRATSAFKIYVCNVATQPGETMGYTVAEHVLSIEQHIGRGVFQAVIAHKKQDDLIENYVEPVPNNHEILQRYEIRYTDLADKEQIWRHHPKKIAKEILKICQEERIGGNVQLPITSELN